MKTVEFIGGEFDGRKEEYEDLYWHVAIPIGKTIERFAFYRLVLDSDRYLYVDETDKVKGSFR